MKSINFKKIALSILMLSGTLSTQMEADEHQSEFPITQYSESCSSSGHEQDPAQTEGSTDLQSSPLAEESSPVEEMLSTEEMVQSTGAALISCSDHWIAGFPNFPNSTVIKLGDGSEWTFNANDLYLVRSWELNDKIDICPKINFLWASDYSYVFTNRSRGNSSLDVNPSLGPVKFGLYSAWVRGIDHANRHVFIVTGTGELTTWVIHKDDEALFRNLSVNSHIIVMNNADIFWWFSPFNRILVHVEFNQQLHARQL